MRAAIVPEPGRIELVEIPEPKYGDYEARVEILACSICSGTDSHIVYGQFPWRAYPCVLGHESIGRVVEVGPAVRNLRPGDLVLRPTAVRPGETLGGYNSMFGSFAEIGIVADAAAIVADTPRGETPKLPPFATAQQVMPPDFDPDLAGAFITFKETLSFLQRLGVQVGKSVLILGSGTVGLSFALWGQADRAWPVIITGRRAEPLAAARGWGADYGDQRQRGERGGCGTPLYKRAGRRLRGRGYRRSGRAAGRDPGGSRLRAGRAVWGCAGRMRQRLTGQAHRRTGHCVLSSQKKRRSTSWCWTRCGLAGLTCSAS